MAVEFVLGAKVRNIFDAASNNSQHAKMLMETHEAYQRESKEFADRGM